ncbi:MAG: phosphotransferase family protein [Myxococcales bacterium]|nr:phosphotransferase family protein [Myxococcales bacterium]
MSLVDEARAVRPGEEVDVAKLEAFLRERAPEFAGPVTVSQFPGGHSNLTYLVTVGSRELVLRRPPFGNRVKSAHDMGREFRILSRLSAVFPKAPRALVYEEADAVLGAPFYLMERIRGLVLRGRALPQGVSLAASDLRALGLAVADTLAELHRVDVVKAELAELGRPEGYVERQVRGWIKRYADARPDDVPEMNEVEAWLQAALVAGVGATAPGLVHNDFKFDNLVLDAVAPTKIVGVLDWEMATYGEPMTDLGTALAYWTEATDPEEMRALPFGPTMLEGSLSRADFVVRWAEGSGREPVSLPFFHAFAHYRTAVVAAQIYWRYRHGHTKDARFAAFAPAVGILARAALRARDER